MRVDEVYFGVNWVAWRLLLVARRGDPVPIEGASDRGDPDRDLFETCALLPDPDATLAWPDVRGVARLHVLTCRTCDAELLLDG